MNAKSLCSLLMGSGLALASVSCGEFVQNSGRGPAQVVINALQGARGGSTEFGTPLFSDVESIVTTPEPCSTTSPCIVYFSDLGQVTMSLILKDPGQAGTTAAPSALNQVTFTRYRVEYQRTDRTNARPGVDVPFPIESALTFTVPADGAVSASFQLVREVAKHEAPLRALRDSGVTLSMIANVTFFGRDQAGNEVIATGSIGVNFANYAP